MTMSDKTSNILFGVAFLALGVYVAQGALNWAVYGHEGPGPGFFPLLYGSLMIFFGGALALGAMVKAKEEAPADDAGPINRIAPIATLVALAVSVPLMSVLGFVVGFGAALFFIIKFVFGQSYVRSIITALGTTVVLHVAFSMLLGVSLPAGMFWGF